MLVFTGCCPHCDSDRGFAAFGFSLYAITERDFSGMPLKDRQILAEKSKDNPMARFSLCGSCLTCKEPVVATFIESKSIMEEMRQAVVSEGMIYRHRPPTPKKLFPEPTPPYTHPSLPEPVRDTFIDLQRMIQHKMKPHMIISGCRTVLEAAVKELAANGDSLFKRISDLRAQGVITGVLADWAHHVRLSGNEAVHEMKGTAAEAHELVEFTKVFLQFTFEFPARIAEVRRQKPQPA